MIGQTNKHGRLPVYVTTDAGHCREDTQQPEHAAAFLHNRLLYCRGCWHDSKACTA